MSDIHSPFDSMRPFVDHEERDDDYFEVDSEDSDGMEDTDTDFVLYGAKGIKFEESQDTPRTTSPPHGIKIHLDSWTVVEDIA